jgi:hypothetical protein
MADKPKITPATLTPRYDDPQDERVAEIVKEILGSRELTIDQLPMQDIIGHLNNGNNPIAPDGLDRRYLESGPGAGYLTEWGTYTTAIAVGLPSNIFASSFATMPVYFDANGWPLASWTSFYKLGSVIGTTGPPYSCTTAYSNGTFQNVTVNWVCIRPRGN